MELATAFGLAEEIAFLERPESYPELPGAVEGIETHLAWVFLTDRHAYKLKKPARSSFADFRSLSARRQDAEDEVRLNRRLAPDVYLGVVALVRDRHGDLALEAEGVPVDWLVKMRRLPHARMLDFAIAAAAVDGVALQSVAELLARFYCEALRVPIAPTEYRRRFHEESADNARALAEPRYGLPTDAIARTLAGQHAFLARWADLLDVRAAAGRIVEGHGDLRPEHVCLGPPPVIIDCVEFNRDFRILDPADELAYLSLECERLGAEEVGATVLARYGTLTGDHPPEALIRFYKSVRAVLRAKLAAWHLDDRTVRYPSQWFNRARAYLALAERYSREE